MNKHLRNSLILTVLCSSFFAFSQQLPTAYKRASTQPEANFYEIVDTYRKASDYKRSRGIVETIDDVKERKQFERWVYFWQHRVDSDGRFPSKLEGWYHAGIIDENGVIVQNKATSSARRAIAKPWVNIGPTSLPEKNGYPNYPQMGRLNCFWRYVHPTNPSRNILLVGAPSGGLWKSTDNGQTWTPKLDQIAGIGVTDIASTSNSTTDQGVIYVSTGDYDGPDVTSIGVYKSVDLGETFTPTGLTFQLKDAISTSDLVVFNANTVVVGVPDGIMRTTNGGTSWTQVYTHDANKYFGRFARKGSNVMCQDLDGGIYFSKNSGATWSVIKENTGTNNGSAVTVDQATGIFYVQSGDNGQVYTYNPTQTNPSLVPLGNPTTDYNSQGNYNQVLVVKDGLIISGGVEGMSSSDNGNSWYNSLSGYWSGDNEDGVYVHSDHHEFGKLNDGYSFYSCNDGGLTFVKYPSKTTLKPTVEYKSSGVAVTQIYSVAITPENDEYYLIGNQDNDGYSREMHQGELKWVAAAAGDGICTAIDYSDPNIRYLGDQNKNLYRTTTGFSGNYRGTKLSTPTGGNFVWPLELHSNNPNILYGGFRDINKSTDRGDSWVNLESGAGTVKNITTFGEVLMVVGKTKTVKSLNGGNTWTDLVEPYRREDINAITFNQSNPDIIYVTVPAYREGEKVYKSTDGGSTWTNISAGLPNIVMNQIDLYQNQVDEILFLGTELGVYIKRNNDPWQKFGDDLPNVIVYDMEINYTSEKLVIATFGRGVWQMDLSDEVTSIDDFDSISETAPIVLQNPVVTNELQIQRRDSKSYNYLIYNTVGGLVHQGTLRSDLTTVDLSNTIKGIYLVKFINENQQSTTSKFILKK